MMMKMMSPAEFIISLSLAQALQVFVVPTALSCDRVEQEHIALEKREREAACT